jgi:hypothetical protein
MQVKTKVKAGLGASNHNQTLVHDRNPATADTRPRAQRQPLKVKTKVKAGVFTANHNQTLVRDPAASAGGTRRRVQTPRQVGGWDSSRPA